MLPKNSDHFFIGCITLYVFSSIPIAVGMFLKKLSPGQVSDLTLLAQLWLIGNLTVGLWYYGYGPFRRKP